MILTAADRERIRDAFQSRIGNTALPAGVTIDDLCANLVLAIPALLETCEEMEEATRCHCGGTLPCEDATCEIGYAVLSRLFATALAPYIARISSLNADNGELSRRLVESGKLIEKLTAQLESDPCP